MISEADILLRLAVAALLGCLVGFERERLMWSAGIRTHMLVSVGSCLLMIVSAYGFQQALLQPHVVLDPARVAAQVVSGIGFLGAGSIILRGQAVRGLTTAASIWAVAAVGLAAGGALYFAAVVSTVIILTILAGIKPLEEAYRARIQSATMELVTERGVIDGEFLKPLLGVRMSQIRRLIVRDDEELQRATIQVVRVSRDDISKGAARLRRAPGVLSVEVVQRGRERPEGDAPSADQRDA
jgi:putative Mg2+ transporter-C (MgtC) family protein